MGFLFPQDTQSRAGAIRVTPDGNNFYLPSVIFGPDGVTPISSTNPLQIGVSDGSFITMGSKADAAVLNPGAAASQIAILKGILSQLLNNEQSSSTGVVYNNQQTITIGATPAASQITIPSNQNIKILLLKNLDTTNPVYLGNSSGVTTSTGFPIDPKDVFTFNVLPGSALVIWAIASATLNLGVMGIA